VRFERRSEHRLVTHPEGLPVFQWREFAAVHSQAEINAWIEDVWAQNVKKLREGAGHNFVGDNGMT
jgi:hypothetical protein